MQRVTPGEVLANRKSRRKRDDLSLDIFVPAANGRASNVRLSECIKRFFAKEELDHCEQYMCSNCKDKRPSTKQLFLRVLPNCAASRVAENSGSITFDLSSVVVHHGSG
ncbi:hypothetical protein TELCIR_18772, partial [Teladorsagia circumcincta]